MTIELWKFPVAPTALIRSPRFATLPKRQCAIYLEFEDVTTITLLFEGVEAFKCTYLTFCTAEMFNTAYGKVVQLGTTAWLTDVQGVGTNSPRGQKDLKHLMICFDDGPCYEFICAGFRIS